MKLNMSKAEHSAKIIVLALYNLNLTLSQMHIKLKFNVRYKLLTDEKVPLMNEGPQTFDCTRAYYMTLLKRKGLL